MSVPYPIHFTLNIPYSVNSCGLYPYNISSTSLNLYLKYLVSHFNFFPQVSRIPLVFNPNNPYPDNPYQGLCKKCYNSPVVIG